MFTFLLVAKNKRDLFPHLHTYQHMNNNMEQRQIRNKLIKKNIDALQSYKTTIWF